MSDKKRIVLTGIKPTGTPHLGNLAGAMRPIIESSKAADGSYVFIADLHALNAERDSGRIRRWTYEIAATFVVMGLDLERTALFRQSDIAEVYQMALLLNNVTPKGLMNRAHAYKAAVQENEREGREPDGGINMGLFTYPVLMAADILLYDATEVPVGPDQKQHVEFARDISNSFNYVYGDILSTPEPVLKDEGAAIPGLDGRKMSKSYENTIPIFADTEALEKLTKRVVTDSRTPEDEKDPESVTIYQIYRHFASEPERAEMARGLAEGGLGYGTAKRHLFEVLERELSPARAQYEALMADPDRLDEILAAGAARARPAARRTLGAMTKAMLGRDVTTGPHSSVKETAETQ